MRRFRMSASDVYPYTDKAYSFLFYTVLIPESMYSNRLSVASTVIDVNPSAINNVAVLTRLLRPCNTRLLLFGCLTTEVRERALRVLILELQYNGHDTTKILEMYNFSDVCLARISYEQEYGYDTLFSSHPKVLSALDKISFISLGYYPRFRT